MRADELLEHYRRGERDFRGVNLRGIYLRDVRLQGIDLNCADLRGASLMSVDFTGANLHRADLSGAFLIHSNLSCTNLTQANLTRACLILANLHQSCLTEANLSQTNLTKADLSDVSGFAEAFFDRTILAGALLPVRSHCLKIWKGWQLEFPKFQLRLGSSLLNLLSFSTMKTHRQQVRFDHPKKRFST